MGFKIEMNNIRTLIDKNDLIEAKEHVENVIEQAMEAQDISSLAKAQSLRGDIFERQGLFKEALNNYKEAKALYEEADNDVGIMATSNVIANLYASMGDLKTALKHYLRVLNYIDTKKVNYDSKGKIINNIALLFKDMRKLDLAEKYLYESIEYAEKAHDYFTKAVGNYNLAQIYFLLGQYTLAQDYAQFSEEEAHFLEDHIGLALIKVLMAMIKHRTGAPWVEVERLFEEVVMYMKAHGSHNEQLEVGNAYGTEAMYAKEYEKALSILSQTFECAHESRNYLKEKEALEALYQVYEALGNIEAAYDASKKLIQLQHYLVNEMEAIDLEHMSQAYEREIRGSELLELKSSLRTLKILTEIGKSITASQEIETIFQTLSEELAKLINIDSFGVGILCPGEDAFDYYIYDDKGTRIAKRDYSTGETLMAQCMRYNQEILIHDVSDVTKYQTKYNKDIVRIAKRREYGSIIFCPMLFGDKIIGGLTAQKDRSHAYSYVDMEILRLLTSYTAIAVNNLQKARSIERQNRRFKNMSRHDGLTGLYNRHELGAYITKKFTRYTEEAFPLTVMMIDIDFFKQYNDNYGHVKGDECLKLLAKVLKNALMPFTSYLFRYGGDEFFLVVEQANKERCQRLINEIMVKVEELDIEHRFSKVSSVVTLTIGAAVISYGNYDYIELFQAADKALYKGKEQGRNQSFILDI